MLLEKIKEPSRFLSTIQVEISFAGFFSSASAAVSIYDDLGGFLSSIGIPLGNGIAFIGVTLLLSYIMLVFGELVPKPIALQNPQNAVTVTNMNIKNDNIYFINKYRLSNDLFMLCYQ